MYNKFTKLPMQHTGIQNFKLLEITITTQEKTLTKHFELSRNQFIHPQTTS